MAAAPPRRGPRDDGRSSPTTRRRHSRSPTSVVIVDHGPRRADRHAREIFERPANEYVMNFLGEERRASATRSSGRTTSCSPTLAEPASEEVLVERFAYLGFEVRVELIAADGRHFDAQLTHEEAERLELARGQIVYARLVRSPASGWSARSRSAPFERAM